jgi:site-specific recombinase XerD
VARARGLSGCRCRTTSAIVGYLRDGRPATAQDRAVFARVRAPHHRLSSGGVTFVVAAAARRAGLGQVHAHRLRHTAASEMLRCGATLPEVGQMLRHRRSATTRDLRQGRPRGAQANRASVAGSDPTSALHDSLAEYLAVRRALGYRLEGTERLVGQFLDYLDANGADRITVELALAWATLPGRGQHWHAMRLGAVRGFARYLHEVDPRVEVPAADLLPDKSGRAVPYLYTDAQIGALIEAARTLRIAHKNATFQTLFGVLAATGMRIGEAISLDRSDFDADAGALTVRNAKFGKSSELPLHPTTSSALTRYLRRRDRPRPVGANEALLLSSVAVG